MTVLAVIMIAIAVASVVVAMRTFAVAPSPASPGVGSSVSVSAEATAGIPARVEMPDVVGMDLEHAQMVLSAAGMAIRVDAEGSPVHSGVDRVVAQDPAAGALTDQNVMAALFVRSVPPTAAASGSAAGAGKPKRRQKARVVCIDPGHQGRSDLTPEPIGPGSKSVKPGVSGGSTGAKTLIPEHEIALQISMNLKKRLEARGLNVVMTRTTNDVSLSNSERARIANQARADLFIRIHADGSPDPNAAGVSTLYPASNKWTKSIANRSKRAAQLVQQASVGRTGAVDRGTFARSYQSGFNWSKVPAVLVECGFLSNPIEDRLLASPHYQNKIAQGICDGAMDYLDGPR